MALGSPADKTRPDGLPLALPLLSGSERGDETEQGRTMKRGKGLVCQGAPLEGLFEDDGEDKQDEKKKERNDDETRE